jgi:FkbM family methyltransferase
MTTNDSYIVDVGMNNGDDSFYYLCKGYKVIAIEANPFLCDQANLRFKEEIHSNRLEVINASVAVGNKPLKFFLNNDNHHLSSLDKHWASRNGASVTEIEVLPAQLDHILANISNIHYIKVDIEGADFIALQQLSRLYYRPKFISVEDCRFGFEYIDLLNQMGYISFNLSDQSQIPSLFDIKSNVGFKLGMSGFFGKDLRGSWLSLNDFYKLYEKQVRPFLSRRRLSAENIWYDIHASLESPKSMNSQL